MRGSRIVLSSVVVVATIVGVGLLHVLRLPEHSLLWRSLFDFGHVPLFGVLAAAVLAVGHRAGLGVPARYSIAVAVVAAIGLAGELLQYFTPRDAAFEDWLHDLGGASAVLAVVSTFDTRADGRPLVPAALARIAVRALALGLVAVLAAPVATQAIAAWQRSSRFPVIAEFESDFEQIHFFDSGADLVVATPPAAWVRPAGRRAGRMTFRTVQYPTWVITEPHPDWRGFSEFRMSLYSEMDRAVTVVLRIDDRIHDESWEDRFNRRIVVQPGANEVRIPLAQIRDAPDLRAMEMSAIRTLMLFAIEPSEPLILWIDDLSLVP